MLDELESCLALYLDPITYEPMVEAYRVLDDIGMEDQDTELLNIMGLDSDHNDSSLLVGRIEACLTYAVGGKLNEYGIIMIDGTPLMVMVKLLEVVATFERYGNHQEVHDLFLSDEYDNEERLAEIAALFSDLEPVDVIYYLGELRESTMLRIKTIVEDELDHIVKPGLPYGTQEQSMCSDVIKMLTSHAPSGQLKVVYQVAEYGHPMLGGDNTINAVLDDTIDHLDTLTDEKQIAYEVTALCIYAYKDYEEYVIEFIDEYSNGEPMSNRLKQHFESIKSLLNPR